MLRQVGIVLLTTIVLAVCGCSSNSGVQQPPPTPTPSPTPSAGSVAINSISPMSAVAGSPNLNLTITGTNLASTGPHNSRLAVWSTNGTILLPSSASSTELVVVVPAALMTVPVTAQVFIEYGDVMGDVPLGHSNSVSFVVTAANVASVSPASAVLGPGSIQQFVATLNGKITNATWQIEEGSTGGSITSSGAYTVPDHIGTFHVVATFTEDSSKSATATVTVVPSGSTAAATMNRPRSGHTATLLKDGRVLILGGGDATAELFDPASGTFSFTGSPVAGRRGATATLLSDGRVLIAGGLGLVADSDGHLPLLNTGEIFDPATGTFSSTGTMVQARRQHTATLLTDGRVLVTGGYFGNICITASTELFDPATELFSRTGFMLSERVGHTATLLASGEVLMAGGSNGCAPDAADDPPWDPLVAELYEPNSQSFQGAGNMSTTRIHHVALRLTNGKVLVLGGIPFVQNLHEQPPNPSYAELYDPVANTFSPIAGLAISHERYTATLMPSGIVLIVGGEDAPGIPTTEVQLLDPASGVLSQTGALGTARVGHTATLLRDGRILVTGGTDSDGNALASAEIYR